MKKVFFALGSITLLGMVFLVFLSTKAVQQPQPQETRTQAAPTTTLSLSPANLTQYPGQSFNTDVLINAGTNQVVSVDIVLTFTPSILEAIEVTAGSFLSNPVEIQKNIDNTTGKITYSFYTFATNAKSGSGTLAMIVFKAKAAGTSAVAFDPRTTIGALGEPQNVLTGTTPASYIIQNDTTPPAAVSDLRMMANTMNTITLAWSAPTDAGPFGKASSYDLRYSMSTITNSNWNSATIVAGEPSPATPGTTEMITVSGLTPTTSYYFAIKSTDAANNTSALSNVLSAATISKPRLIFQIKFQGIITQIPNAKVTAILKQSGTTKFTFNNTSLTSNASGIYSGTLVDIDQGTYDVYLKGWSHLQKKFANVILNPGTNSQDWSGTILKAGDLDGNNLVNAVDIAGVIQDYFPNTPAGSIADFNLDGVVNAIDIGFVIENYFQQGD